MHILVPVCWARVRGLGGGMQWQRTCPPCCIKELYLSTNTASSMFLCLPACPCACQNAVERCAPESTRRSRTHLRGSGRKSRRAAARCCLDCSRSCVPGWTRMRSSTTLSFRAAATWRAGGRMGSVRACLARSSPREASRRSAWFNRQLPPLASRPLSRRNHHRSRHHDLHRLSRRVRPRRAGHGRQGPGVVRARHRAAR
jgi:hypothetical protein